METCKKNNQHLNVYKPTKSNFTIQFICNMLKLNMYHVTSILAMEHNIWQYPVDI